MLKICDELESPHEKGVFKMHDDMRGVFKIHYDL